jgi:hypothetical protein
VRHTISTLARTGGSVLISPKALTALLLSGMAAASAAAQPTTGPQDRPFVFSISTPSTETPHATVHLDTGFGERPFDVVQGDRLEQRLGIQAFVGRGLTVLARVGIAADQRDLRASQQGELLYSVVRGPANHGALAVGIGMRHESEGVNVLLWRAAAGRTFSAWRLDGSALVEKPFSIGRDSVDLITTMGVARRLSRAVHAGIEMIGEDLEGFWEADEAEGGARLLVGPSLRVAPPSARWQISAAGGPVIHRTESSRTSDALRSLPLSDGNNGFAVRASLSYGF